MPEKIRIREKDLNVKVNWVTVILILLFLYLLSMITSSFFSTGDTEIFYGNVALIRINAPITAESISIFRERTIGSDEIIEFIDKADKNPAVEAILFEINSPGGTPVASSEIVNRIKELNKTTVSYIREMGVSGAYWIASATNYIFANSMSLVGSVGVYGSYLELSGLLERYNITYQRLVGGAYKDIGTPLKKLTPVEERILQENINELHDMFLESIKQNRRLDEKTALEVKKALFYNGENAYLMGLIDEIGGKKQAIEYIEAKLNITAQVAEYKKTETFFDMLRGLSSDIGFNLGEGLKAGIMDSGKNLNIKS